MTGKIPTKNKPQTGHGIEAFFNKSQRNERVTPEAAKIPDSEYQQPNSLAGITTSDFLRFLEIMEILKSKPFAAAAKPRKPALKVVDPPTFQAVRAATTTTEQEFELRLKIREFVLRCTTLPFPFPAMTG